MCFLGFKHAEETKKKIRCAVTKTKNRRKPYNKYGGIGLHIATRGYLTTMKNGKHKAIHRLIAEKAINRELKKEELVHHINMKKLDNRNCNLLICDGQYHQLLHQKMAEAWVRLVNI